MKLYGDFRDLKAYIKGFQQISMIFKMSLSLPKEEKFSLTDQIRRSSRSVCANLAEAYRKRDYPKHFLLKITDCLGENSETQVWLDIALDCNYISTETYDELSQINDETGKLLMYIYNNPEKFGVH